MLKQKKYSVDVEKITVINAINDELNGIDSIKSQKKKKKNLDNGLLIT